jgi:hypothetical protein
VVPSGSSTWVVQSGTRWVAGVGVARKWLEQPLSRSAVVVVWLLRWAKVVVTVG